MRSLERGRWSDKAKSIVHGAECEEVTGVGWQRTEYRGQKLEFGNGKSERSEDRCQILFLLNQLIQPCQLINHIYTQPVTQCH